MVADTDSESGAEASDVEDYFEEDEEEEGEEEEEGGGEEGEEEGEDRRTRRRSRWRWMRRRRRRRRKGGGGKEEEKKEEEEKEEEEEKKEEEVEEEEEEKKNSCSCSSLTGSRNTGCKKWQITNLGTASRNTNIYPFVSPAKGVKKSGDPYINKHSSPLSVLLLLFFMEIFHLLMEKTNIYYQHLDKSDLAAVCLTL